jgi:PAS domain S-box-containing protein
LKRKISCLRLLLSDFTKGGSMAHKLIPKYETEYETRSATQQAQPNVSSLFSNLSPELLWQLSLEQLDVAIGIKHASGEMIYVNQTFCDLLELPKESIIGKRVEEALPKQTYEQQKALLEKERERRLSGKSSVYDLEIEVAGGKTKTVRVHASPILDRDKNYLGSIGIVTDVSQEKSALKSASDAQALLAAVFNVASVGLCITDSDGVVVAANPADSKIHGYTHEEFVGGLFTKALPPELREDALRLHREYMEETLNEMSGEWQVLHKNGTLRDVAVNVARLVLDDGRKFRVTAVTDITERKLIERQLRYQAQLLENVSNAVVAVDNEYHITAWNSAAEKLYGWKATEVLGKHLFQVTQPRYLNGESEDTIVESVLKAGKWIGELVDKRKDGTEIIAEACISMLRNERGDIIGAVGIKRNVTERKQIERQLRYQAQLLENVSDAVMAVDNDYIITSWNTAAEKLYGWTATEVLGKNIYHILPHRYLSDVNDEIVSEVMRTAGKWVGEVIQKRKDGTEVITEACVSQIHNEKDEVIGLVSINRDITEQKRHAEERQRLYEQLQHLQKMESIGRLAGGIAHDFNNILAAILGNVKMATEKTTDEKVTKYLSRIKAASERASALTQQLLGFARQGKYEVTAVDLQDCVRNVVEMLEHTIDKRIEVVVEPAHMSTKVMGDRTQLEQVILNLAVNAIDAMMPTLEAKQSGILRFSWGSGVREEIKTINTHLLPNQPYLCLAVSDSGIGIPKDIQKKIFEPFFTTKEIGKGTGLGLAMVYGIMQNHHGAVHVESEVGKGTTFELYFPELLESQTENGVTGTYINQKLMNNKRVLIVDDEDMLRELLTEQLTEAGYAVCEACNGAEAIEVLKRLQAEQVRVDAVVLDMNMPKMDGARAFAEIRALFPRMPILIATGYAQDEMVQKVVESGANGVLVKPYDAEALFEKLSEILKMRA